MLMSVPEDPPRWVYEMYGRNEHVKKKLFFMPFCLVHSVAKSAHHQTSSFFHFFFDLRKQVEQVISFYIHFSSSHFFVVVFFIFFFISYPKKMNNIQHIYWKVIYVHAPLTQMCYNTVESVTFYLCCRYNF